MKYDDDISPIITRLNSISCLHELESIHNEIGSIIARYRGSGYVNWETTNEAESKYTWTWNQIKPMLLDNLQVEHEDFKKRWEVEDFERRYVSHPDTVMEVTNKQVSKWELQRYDDSIGRSSLQPVGEK